MTLKLVMRTELKFQRKLAVENNKSHASHISSTFIFVHSNFDDLPNASINLGSVGDLRSGKAVEPINSEYSPYNKTWGTDMEAVQGSEGQQCVTSW